MIEFVGAVLDFFPNLPLERFKSFSEGKRRVKIIPAFFRRYIRPDLRVANKNRINPSRLPRQQLAAAAAANCDWRA